MKIIIMRRALISVTLIGLALLPLLGTISTVRAATTYMVTSNADSGSGSFRDALSKVADGDTITFTAGVGTITLKSNLPVIKLSGSNGLTIQGNGATIQAKVQIRGLTVTAGVVSIDNLTITGGNCTNFGCPDDGSGFGGPTDGGGIFNDGTVTVRNSMLTGNSGGVHGGAIYNASHAVLSLINSTLSINRSPDFGFGGGVFNGGTLTISNTVFSGNSAQDGGGIFNGGGTVTVSNSTFSGNSADGNISSGGGIDNDGGTVTVTNSTFFNNVAAGGYSSGGGISNDGQHALLALISSTISGNSAGKQGGGINNDAGVVTIRNSILAHSMSGACYSIVGNTITATGQNIIDDSTCGSTNIIQADPLLAVSIADNGGSTQTLALLPGSPAIGAATDCLATDQRELPRKSPRCDIGAFETQPIVPTITPSPTTTPTLTATPTLTPSMTPTATSTLIPLTATHATSMPIPFCTDNGTLNGTNPTTRTATVTNSGVFCQIIAKNGVFVRSSSEIGIQSVLDRGVIQAVDVFGLLAGGQSVVVFNSPVQICLQGSGAFLFINASQSLRSAIQLPTTSINGYACANIPNAGTVVLTQH